MNKKPKNAIEGSTSNREARKFFEKNEFSYLIVIQQGKPIGYVDPQVLQGENPEIKNVTESFPVIVGVQDTLKDAMSHMLMNDMRDLPVVDDHGDFVGAISYNDIRKHILKIYTQNAG